MPVVLSLGKGLCALSRGAARAAASRFRALGLLARSPDIDRRLAICRECHLCTVTRGGVYCGRPLLGHLVRDLEREGCGCPIAAKAADPHEHCPVHLDPEATTCTCKWCRQND